MTDDGDRQSEAGAAQALTLNNQKSIAGHGWAKERSVKSMNLLLLIIVLLLLFGGGGFYFGGPAIGGGGLGLVLLIVLIVYLMGGFRGRP